MVKACSHRVRSGALSGRGAAWAGSLGLPGFTLGTHLNPFVAQFHHPVALHLR
jgi:hypothetical protein